MEKKTQQLHILASAQEITLIQERMDVLGIKNMSSYIRKMAIDGYIVHLDLSDVRELVTLLRRCSNNLNQYARRANETGSIYAADIADLQQQLDRLWSATGKVLAGLSEVP
jgi:hypothetical protein